MEFPGSLDRWDRFHRIIQKGKDYKWYIRGIYCQLGDDILPYTVYPLLREPETTMDKKKLLTQL